jgi:hypothetical protein
MMDVRWWLSNELRESYVSLLGGSLGHLYAREPSVTGAKRSHMADK